MDPRRPLVLLVEDDLDTATLFQAILSAEGLEVARCRSIGEALRWWRDVPHPPRLLVVDVRLPDGNGLDLCRTIMEISSQHTPPGVLILSAHGDPRLPAACRQAGWAFLDKLAGQDRLVAKVHRLLSQH